MTAQILVVDDEPDLELLIQQKFRHQIREGVVTFLFARDGVDALAQLQSNGSIDMVVTDINMPRMDGLSLLQKLQETEDKPSTIIVSAYGDMANIRTAMNRGAFDFLTKPIDLPDLEATIAKTIRHVEALREARERQAAAERAHASLSRYFSPNLAQRLASDAAAVDLRGQRREIATLFSDIASFTTLVESLEPDVLGPLLNDYLVGMTDMVFAHDGTVAKIVGDAMHVLFGAPGEQPDHAARAVACALALDEFARGFRERWRQKGIALGVTRIGVHPARRSSAISAAAVSSTTPHTAIPSMSRHGSKPPTNSSARAFASAPYWRERPTIFAAGRWAICCCAARPRRYAPSSRSRAHNTTPRRPPAISTPLPSSKQMILVRWRRLRPMLASTRMISSPAFT